MNQRMGAGSYLLWASVSLIVWSVATVVVCESFAAKGRIDAGQLDNIYGPAQPSSSFPKVFLAGVALFLAINVSFGAVTTYYKSRHALSMSLLVPRILFT